MCLVSRVNFGRFGRIQGRLRSHVDQYPSDTGHTDKGGEGASEVRELWERAWEVTGRQEPQSSLAPGWEMSAESELSVL